VPVFGLLPSRRHDDTAFIYAFDLSEGDGEVRQLLARMRAAA
jgi:hypothetical protein